MRHIVKAKCMNGRLFKVSQVRLKPEIERLADKGYQGIQKPAQRRVVGEQVNRCLKIFKILCVRAVSKLNHLQEI